MYTEKSNQIKKKIKSFIYIFFFTSSTIPIILCALLDILSHAMLSLYAAVKVYIQTRAMHFQQLFLNVYYITATKQHNAAHYRHIPGDEHRMRYLDNPRLPVHACTLTHILQRLLGISLEAIFKPLFRRPNPEVSSGTSQYLEFGFKTKQRFI